MGVFVPDSPFRNLTLFGVVTITGVQQLFFLGAVAIAVGVFTYSDAEDLPSHRLPDHVPQEVARMRYEALMERKQSFEKTRFGDCVCQRPQK